jgi:UDPglucose 6-dehydrogenase
VDNSRLRFPELTLVKTVEEAAEAADAVMVLTEWKEYRQLDPGWLGAMVGTKTIVDGRNCLDPVTWRAAGWRYRALGRP